MTAKAVRLERDRASGLLGGLPPWTVLCALTVLVIALALASVTVGAVPVEPAEVVAAIARGLRHESVGSADFIVWELRLPRVITAVLVGGGLALAGLIVQVLVSNPIADPFVLGLSSGAGLGAVLAIGVGGAVGLGVPGGALLGAVLTGLVVALLSSTLGGFPATRLVMVGIAVGHLASGAMSFVIIRTGDADVAQQVMYWMLGSLSGAQWRQIAPLFWLLACALVAATLTTPWLDALALGDDGAAALGLRAGAVRVFFFALASAVTATVVSISGTIGFVGFVVPNAARLLVGGVHRRLVPTTVLLGAILVLGADTAARTILAPSEVPIGILTAAIGVPLFVLVVRRGMRGMS